MRGTELLFESSALGSEPGRARLASILYQVCQRLHLTGPAIVAGAGVVLPAEPIPVFRALQGIDPHWYRLLALIPSESALAQEAAQLQRPLTVTTH